MDEPIFEIVTDGKHYKIYDNGKVEGFGPPERVYVISNLNYAIEEAILRYSMPNRDGAEERPPSNLTSDGSGFSQGTAP
jgi:hypothetical protein